MNKVKKPISTSRDYPLYEKMKKKCPKASKYWIAGDRFYHTGLFLTMLCIPALFFVYTQTGIGGLFPWTITTLIGSVGVFILGIYLKKESYKLAIKAGIDITQF